jgi:hypothetical protein
LNCNICHKPTKNESACWSCRLKLQSHLIELPELQYEAGMFITPSRTGSGAVSAERSIGVNVSALDFSMATELLAILHGWEAMVREARRLTPPALLNKEPTTDAEVQATCDFHLAHLDWTIGQEWVRDFAGEVAELHAKGMAAAKRFTEQPRRIPCPTDDCKKFVVIDVVKVKENGLADEVTCFGCKQSWSLIRLVTLAMSNPTRKFFLDVEAIALWLGIKPRQVYAIIKENGIQKQSGNLYSLGDVINARN